MKRFIALILTLSMCISIAAFVPTVSAADVEPTVYDFALGTGLTKPKNNVINPTTTPWYPTNTRNWKGFDVSDNIKEFFVKYNDNETPLTSWTFDNGKTYTTADLANISIRIFRGQTAGLLFSPSMKYSSLQANFKDAWIAFKLDAPNATRGAHKITFEWADATNTAASDCDIFFAPYNGTDDDGQYYIDNGEQIGDGLTLTSSPSTFTLENSVKITDAEQYILVIRLNGCQNSNKLYLKTIALTKTEDEPVAPKTVAYGTNIDGVISIKGAGITRGTEVTVTAPATNSAGEVFRHWVLGTATNGTWVSDEATYTFPLMTNTYLTAVYAPAPAEGEKIVEFFNYNGEYLTQKTVNAEGKVELPTDEPSLTGYEFSRWLLAKETSVTAETVFTNAITRVVAELTAIGSYTVTDEEYTYDDEITNSADAESEWYRDGVLVGYGKDYSYFVWNNVDEITSAPITAEKTPIVVLDGNVKTGKACMIEYDAAGKTIKEVGILFGATDKIDIDSCDSKATSQRNVAHGQFTAKPRTDVNALYARGYIIYEDDGLKVKYTEAIDLN